MRASVYSLEPDRSSLRPALLRAVVDDSLSLLPPVPGLRRGERNAAARHREHRDPRSKVP